jgi:hypothetical protein
MAQIFRVSVAWQSFVDQGATSKSQMPSLRRDINTTHQIKHRPSEFAVDNLKIGHVVW